MGSQQTTKQRAIAILKRNDMAFERVPALDCTRGNNTYIEIFYNDEREFEQSLTSLVCHDWQDVVNRLSGYGIGG